VSAPGPDATRRALAVLFARVVLGLIFFQAGCWKVFVLTPVGHAKKWFLPFADTFLPLWSLWAMGVTIPFAELIGGFLVLVGLYTTAGLSMLGAVLCVVTFGHLLHEPLYALHEHVIPRLALTLFVLALPRAWDRFSLDAWRLGRARVPQASAGEQRA
jgi:putative oxidoreductase